MTQLRPISDAKTWKLMNLNHYTHIFILGILMLVAQFIFPGMLEPVDGQNEDLGFILYNFIALTMTLAVGFGGWYVCSKTVNQGERNDNL